MVRTKPTVLLNEAFPEAFDGKGIFSEMTGMPWSESTVIDSSLLDIDYFGNHSGDKKCAPLLYHLMEEDHTISDENRQKIAALVVARFLPNWQALWNTYHLEYDPITDYSMTETGENEEESSGNKSASKSGTNTGTDNLSLQHGETVSKTGSNTGTDNLSIVHGEQIQMTDETSGENHNFKFGFNSSEHVPTEDATASTTEQRGETHSGTDQHNRTLGLANTESETHGGTDSHNRTLNLANSESESGTESGTKSGSYSKTRSGLTGAHYIQELIQKERELWIEDYFERVFADIDSVVASMIYVRENRANHYPLFPFGYYNF